MPVGAAAPTKEIAAAWFLHPRCHPERAQASRRIFPRTDNAANLKRKDPSTSLPVVASLRMTLGRKNCKPVTLVSELLTPNFALHNIRTETIQNGIFPHLSTLSTAFSTGGTGKNPDEICVFFGVSKDLHSFIQNRGDPKSLHNAINHRYSSRAEKTRPSLPEPEGYASTCRQPSWGKSQHSSRTCPSRASA